MTETRVPTAQEEAEIAAMETQQDELTQFIHELAGKYVKGAGRARDIFEEGFRLGASCAILEHLKYLNERDLNLFPKPDWITGEFVY